MAHAGLVSVSTTNENQQGRNEPMTDGSETKNRGAVKAGNGKYGFMIGELDQIEAGTGYSAPARGSIRIPTSSSTTCCKAH
jgi:hypothetical protein